MPPSISRNIGLPPLKIFPKKPCNYCCLFDIFILYALLVLNCKREGKGGEGGREGGREGERGRKEGREDGGREGGSEGGSEGVRE